MATVSAIFTFALPDDTSSDKLRIYVSTTETGSYTLDTTFNYSYGYRTQEYDSVDTTKWYKLEFYNSTEDEAGPKSNPVFGGDFGDRDTPFLALSSSFDGANYASATELYNLTGLTSTDISVAKVQSILRSTRAYIDLRMDSNNLGKYSKFFNSSTARAKYNASLRVIKDVELNLAASVVFRSLADNQQLDILRGTVGKGKRAFSVGNTSINTDTAGQTTVAFTELSSRYANMAASLFNSIRPSTIQISYSDNTLKGPLFIHPAEATGNIYVQSGNVGNTFTQYTADLTGLGDDINGAFFSINGNAVVEGVANQSVDPLESQSAIVDAELYVNGILYHLDDWVDNGSTTQPGKGGTTGGTTGFSVDFSTSPNYIDLKWNNTAANGGFDLVSTDEVILKYWILGNS